MPSAVTQRTTHCAPADVEREVAVMLLLSDHPATLRLHQVGRGAWVRRVGAEIAPQYRMFTV